MAKQDYGVLLLEKRNKLLIIKFNRPDKKNAMNQEIYNGLSRALREAAINEDVNAVALTGVGDFYSSGNDLSGLPSLESGEVNLSGLLSEKKAMIIDFIKTFLNFPKLLIAVINGPCIGIAATTAALCDIVYCSETTYFSTPFVKLGICAEGGSSYLFPKILGKSKAMEMLLCGHKLTAEEALKFNLVSEIFKLNEIEKIWSRILEFSTLPIGALKATKGLVIKIEREKLEQAILNEADALEKRWQSDEFFEAVLSYFKSKM